MTNESKKFDFTQALKQLEDINAWFQHEDFNLDEGLRKLKAGKELIKTCRSRLHEVENEFVKIKQEFTEESQASEALDPLPDGHRPTRSLANEKAPDPEDIPF